MDRYLSYQPHIDKLTQKCNGVLIALSHAKNTMPRSVIKPIVQALAVSIVRYCISIYGSCTETQLHRVQKVVNFCVRVVTGRRKHDHISDAFLELGWFNAHELKQYHQLCVFHRSLTTGQPEQLASTFGHAANQRHGHDTRAQSYQHVTTSARPHFGVVMSPCPHRVPTARMATSGVLEVVQCQSAIAECADSDWLIASWQLIWQLWTGTNSWFLTSHPPRILDGPIGNQGSPTDWRHPSQGPLIQAWPSGQIILTDDVLGSKRGTVRYDETMMFCVLW